MTPKRRNDCRLLSKFDFDGIVSCSDFSLVEPPTIGADESLELVERAEAFEEISHEW